jgi:hypothetical protein
MTNKNKILRGENMRKTDYYDLCKDCEYLYHCFGREIGEKIEKEEVDDMYLCPGTCISYCPERKQ